MTRPTEYNTTTEQVVLEDLGRIPFKEAWDLQTELNSRLIAWKRNPDPQRDYQPHYLLVCEHNPVYTLGKTGSEAHLLSGDLRLKGKPIEYFRINRGGDITYHGPGQIVAYPIFDLDRMFTDIHRYIRTLEEAVILTLAEYGVRGSREKDFTGVWIREEGKSGVRKICAIGVHLSRWVTMHGLAFNINTDLEYFNLIVPCGISDSDKSVTSLEKELGRKVDLEEVKSHLCRHFANLFDYKYAPHVAGTDLKTSN